MFCATLAVFAAMTVTQTVRADDTDEVVVASPPPSLRYVKPAEPEVVRALLVESVIFGVGLGQYLLDTSNSRDWDLDYDWPSLRSKLTLRSIAFDNNRFPTNFVTHPVAGTFYYGAARAHRLSIVESFLLASATSTLWELLGEWREQASINDLVVTPASGVPLGEATFHLGAFFQRSRPGSVARAASWLFGPLKNTTDWMDEATPLPPPSYDGSYPSDVWHRFRIGGGGGTTFQDGARGRGDATLTLDSRIVELPDYQRDGRHARWFDEGEVSSIALRSSMGHAGFTDFQLETSVWPAGYYESDMSGGSGHSTITALVTDFEYGAHDYDRDGRRGDDHVSMVDLGVAFEHIQRRGALGVTLSARATGGFAGVGAYARTDYLIANGGKRGLSSVAANEGYAFAIVTSAAPRLELSAGAFSVGGSARFDWFRSLDVLDREASPDGVVSGEDRRTSLATWIAIEPHPSVRLSAGLERRERTGSLGRVTSSRGETALSFGTAFAF